MATKPVKVLTDLLTKKQIIKQDVDGNTLFNVSGVLGNGHVSSSLPVTASYFVGDGRYLTNVTASSGGGGGISSVYTSGSITGSGLEVNPVSLKDPLVIGTITSSFLYSSQITGSLHGTASFATTASYAANANIDLTQFPTKTEVTGVLTNYATLSGVSASFTTPTQVTSALSPYALSVNISASFVDNSELSSAIANFPTKLEVSGAITTSLTPYATLSGVSGTFAAIADVSASFTTPSQITGALTNYVTTTTFNAFSGSYNTGSFSGSLLGTASFATTASYAQNSSITTAAIQNAYNRLRYQLIGNFDITGSAIIMLPSSSLGADSFPISSFDDVNVSVMIKENNRWINDLVSVQMFTSSTNIFIELSAPALNNTDQYKVLAVNEDPTKFLV